MRTKDIKVGQRYGNYGHRNTIYLGCGMDGEHHMCIPSRVKSPLNRKHLVIISTPIGAEEGIGKVVLPPLKRDTGSFSFWDGFYELPETKLSDL